MHSIALALLYAAAMAIPHAPHHKHHHKRQAAATTSSDWSAIWASEQASMVSVLNAMATKSGSQSTASYNAPAPTSAPSKYGTPSYRATSTSTSTIYVTTPLGGVSSAYPNPPSLPTLALASSRLSSSSFTASSTSSPSSRLDTPTPTPQSAENTSNTDYSVTKVINATAFSSGAACEGGKPSSGVLAVDQYECYGNTASTFPAPSSWASWESMWAGLSKLIPESCVNLGDGPPVTQEQVQMVEQGILAVAEETLVDPRVILAVMMQESKGCVSVGTTNNGVSNPGLMQSHAGTSFCGSSASAQEQQASITQMLRDGVAGTGSGPGLVQGINKFGNVWDAVRIYNSGCANTNNLNDGISSTSAYVMSIANYLTGWVQSPATAPSCGGESRSMSQSTCNARLD